MASDITAAAALSQPFGLGMLYDARKDRLTPGFMLWDDQIIQEHTQETPQPSTHFNVSTSDSTESKTSLLEVDASLKASFLSGLVEVSGSAKYLNDQKNFMNQSRVTFQHSATTIFRQLTMTHLGALDPQQISVFEKGFATHVVTKILFGANAFFLFDSEKLEASSVKEMEGHMEAVINKIPTFVFEGKVDIKLTEEEKSLIQKFSCKFHGDFILESNPATFVDAVKTFAELPKLLGPKGEKTVPVKVWLMPLKNLLPEAPELKSEISIGLVRRMEDALEDVKQMETRCNDALVDGVGEDFPQIQEDLRKFQKLCHYYTSNLQETMEKKLPSIREDKEDESSLKQLFDDRNTSPFSHEKLLKCLEFKTREINVIRSIVQITKGIKIVRNQSELDREVLNPGVEQALCYVFTSLESADPCLDAMTQYLDSLQSKDSSDVPWYYSDEVLTKMRDKARVFNDIATQLKDYKKVRFLIAAIANENHVGASLYHYEDGVLVTDDFSKPDIPPVETITDKRKLIWYFCALHVDEDTINNKLKLFEKKYMVKKTGEGRYPDNPKRFDTTPQFLCKESLTGRHYWEVEWSGWYEAWVLMAVSYFGLRRKDPGEFLGLTNKALVFGYLDFLPQYPESSIIAYGYPGFESPCPPVCNRIGFYLDWAAGTLSVYRVSSNDLTHFYTFQRTFTEPVYPAFGLGYDNNSVTLGPPE